jgi:hypothetical protein
MLPPSYNLEDLSKNLKLHLAVIIIFGSPNEIRTRVTAVKGRCPRPLDDGTIFHI